MTIIRSLTLRVGCVWAAFLHHNKLAHPLRPSMLASPDRGSRQRLPQCQKDSRKQLVWMQGRAISVSRTRARKRGSFVAVAVVSPVVVDSFQAKGPREFLVGGLHAQGGKLPRDAPQHVRRNVSAISGYTTPFFEPLSARISELYAQDSGLHKYRRGRPRASTSRAIGCQRPSHGVQ